MPDSPLPPLRQAWQWSVIWTRLYTSFPTRATLKAASKILALSYSVLKFRNFGKFFLLAMQNWQCQEQRQHVAKNLVFTHSSSSQNISCLSFRIDGTTGLFSLITPLAFAVFNLDEIRVLSSSVGCNYGCQLPSLAGKKLSNSVLLSVLLQETNRPRNAATPSIMGSPRILWLALIPDWQVNEKIARSSRSENIGGTVFLEIFSAPAPDEHCPSAISPKEPWENRKNVKNETSNSPSLLIRKCNSKVRQKYFLVGRWDE